MTSAGAGPRGGPLRRISAKAANGEYLDRFGLLVAVTGLSIVGLALIDLDDASGGPAGQLAAWSAQVLAALALLVTTYAAGAGPVWRRASGIGVAVIVLVSTVQVLTYGSVGLPVGLGERRAPLIGLVLAVVAPLLVVRRLLRHREVTRGTVTGAVAAYLLIPVAYYYAYLTADGLLSTPVFGTPQSTTSFMYFSLITVTTVGFGDLAPTGDLPRLLAASEAVIGQVYLVTFLSLVVGLLASRRQSNG